MKMYKACLNENPPAKNGHSSGKATSMASTLLANDASISHLDAALLEAAFKEATSSNRSLASSTTFASHQLIAAANATRSAQQQQPQKEHTLSVRTTADSDSATRGCLSAGANSKANVPFSALASATFSSSYPSLLEEAVRSNSIAKLFNEVAKQQSCKTCGNGKTSNDTVSLTDKPFLTPKAMDVTTSRVCFHRWEGTTPSMHSALDFIIDQYPCKSQCK